LTQAPGTQLSGQPDKNLDLEKVKSFLVNALSREVESEYLPVEQRRQALYQRLNHAYTRMGIHLSDDVKQQLMDEVFEEMMGYGPLQPLLDDPQITEIMVNGPRLVYVERSGEVSRTDVAFNNSEHLLQIIQRIVTPRGRQIDPDHPTVDTRLPDGSWVHAVIPPVAIDGPSLTIRKFGKDRLSCEQLIESDSLTRQMADFLQACVVARINILVSGSTGSGKTTLLNVLSGFIPEDERIVTIEDAAELQLHQENLVRLETKPPNSNGIGAVTTRDLIRNSLRMRPERIIVGELRGSEALDMLQAMNTGHDGSLTTLHANTPKDAISRLETMALMSGVELPIRVVREQIASAVDLIIQQTRLRDGTRKITQITELGGMEGDTIVLTDIFRFEQTGIDPEGHVLGELKPTGIRPLFSTRLETAGFKLSPEIFGVNIADVLASNRRSGWSR